MASFLRNHSFYSLIKNWSDHKADSIWYRAEWKWFFSHLHDKDSNDVDFSFFTQWKLNTSSFFAEFSFFSNFANEEKLFVAKIKVDANRSNFLFVWSTHTKTNNLSIYLWLCFFGQSFLLGKKPYQMSPRFLVKLIDKLPNVVINYFVIHNVLFLWHEKKKRKHIYAMYKSSFDC